MVRVAPVALGIALSGTIVLTAQVLHAATILGQGSNASVNGFDSGTATAAPLLDSDGVSGAGSGLANSTFSGTPAVPVSLADTKLDGQRIEVTHVVTVPLPAAVWLFGSAFLGLCWLGRRAAMGHVGMLPRE